MLLAGIVDGDDLRVIQTARSFRLAEKALLYLDKFIRLEFLRKRHGLDSHNPPDLRVPAKIHHTHGTLAKFLLHLIAAEHWLFKRPTALTQNAGVTASTATTTENDGLGHLFRTSKTLLQIAEFWVVIGHVSKHRLGLVELALALKVERQVVQVIHQRVINRHFAKIIE